MIKTYNSFSKRLLDNNKLNDEILKDFKDYVVSIINVKIENGEMKFQTKTDENWLKTLEKSGKNSYSTIRVYRVLCMLEYLAHNNGEVIPSMVWKPLYTKNQTDPII